MKKLPLLVSIGALLGCNEMTCPPDYPLARDGYCYRADGGMVLLDAGAAGIDGSAADDDAGGGGTDAGDVDAAVICNPAHPMFDGTGNRWCDPGCYCSSTDACFAAEVADACCDVDVVCGPPDMDAGSGVICNGTHPLVRSAEPTRYCDPGNCYCGDLSRTPPLDACYPMGVSDACCP